MKLRPCKRCLIGVSAFLDRLAPSQIKLVIAFLVSCALLQCSQKEMRNVFQVCQARFVSHKFQCFQLSSSVLVQTSSSQRLSHPSGFQFSLRTCSSQVLQSFQSSQALVRVQTKVSFLLFSCFQFFLVFVSVPQFSFRSFYCFSASLVHSIQFLNSLVIVSSQHGDKDLLIDPHQSFYHRIILIIVVSLFGFLMLLYFTVMLFDIFSVYLSLLYSLFVTLSQLS